MDFIERVAELAANIRKFADCTKTEQATKTAFVMPFIIALGYNVFDPREVIPEYTADVPGKKGEKVDYAVCRDCAPVMLIECKCFGCDLDSEHASQLFRYFTVTEARFGVLTNGAVYRFYTDLEEPNKMDAKPFFEFNMLDIKDPQVEELKKFTKSSWDTDRILATASDLKYTREIKRLLADELASPSDAFVRLLTSKVYSRSKTQPILQQFSGIVVRAAQQLRSEWVSDRLKSALVSENEASAKEMAENTEEPVPAEQASQIVTTQDELEAYFVVKSILREAIDVRRVVLRDAKSYCCILLDNNNRKTICRLRFGPTKKHFGWLDSRKNETIEPIDDVDDIYHYAEQIKATAANYDKPGAA